MKQLSKKEIKELVAKTNLIIDKKSRVFEKDNTIYIENKPYFIKTESLVLPLLHNPNVDNLPSIFIDKNAIPFIAKGADLMRPGVTEISDFKKDDVVAIKDEIHKKTIALGIALFNSEEIKEMKKGKVIKTYTYVGDKYW